MNYVIAADLLIGGITIFRNSKIMPNHFCVALMLALHILLPFVVKKNAGGIF